MLILEFLQEMFKIAPLLDLKLHKSVGKIACASEFDTGTDFRQNLLVHCEICVSGHGQLCPAFSEH